MDNQPKKGVNKKVKKFYIVLGMLLILLIPIAFMSGIIRDRESYKDEAVNNVKMSWADSQIIYPPSLTLNIPSKKGITKKTLELNNYEAEVEVKTETRKKGIFTVPVYIAEVELKGDFINPDGKIKNINTDLSFNVSDSKGFVSQPEFKLLSDKSATNTSKKYTKTLNTNAKNIPFEIKSLEKRPEAINDTLYQVNRYLSNVINETKGSGCVKGRVVKFGGVTQ